MKIQYLFILFISFQIFSTGCGTKTGKAGTGDGITNLLPSISFSKSNSTFGYDLDAINVVDGFNLSSGTNGPINSMLFDSSTGVPVVIIGGDFTTYNGQSASHIAKIKLSDGSLDTSFKASVNCNVTSLSLSINGQYLFIGCTNAVNNEHTIVTTIHTNTATSAVQAFKGIIPVKISDGTVDTFGSTFASNTGGLDTSSATNRIEAILPINNNYLLFGQFGQWGTTNTKGLIAVQSNGTNSTSYLNSTSMTGLLSTNDSIKTAYVINDGGVDKLIVGGSFSTLNTTSGLNNYARLNINGTTDTAFAPGFTTTGPVYTIVPFTSGTTSTYLVGLSNYVIPDSIAALSNTSNAVPVNNTVYGKGLMAIDYRGVINPAFNSAIGNTRGITGDHVSAIATLSTNSTALIGGVFSAYNGVNRYYMAKVSTASTNFGALITTCNPGKLFSDGDIKAIIPYSGKIYVAGSFYVFNSLVGSVRMGLVKLNSDCTLDTGVCDPTDPACAIQ